MENSGISYYERRFDFIVRELLDGRMTKEDVFNNHTKVETLMRDYINLFGSGDSSMSFTFLQDFFYDNLGGRN